MDEKLKEFVENLFLKEHCTSPADYFEADVSWAAIEDFAQAVADFTEKRVLEELKLECERRAHSLEMPPCIWLQEIDSASPLWTRKEKKMGRIEIDQSEYWRRMRLREMEKKQLEAFLPGGAVERLGEWAYRVLRVHVPVQDYLYENGRAILAELEALLTKKEGKLEILEVAIEFVPPHEMPMNPRLYFCSNKCQRCRIEDEIQRLEALLTKKEGG